MRFPENRPDADNRACYSVGRYSDLYSETNAYMDLGSAEEDADAVFDAMEEESFSPAKYDTGIPLSDEYGSNVRFYTETPYEREKMAAEKSASEAPAAPAPADKEEHHATVAKYSLSAGAIEAPAPKAEAPRAEYSAPAPKPVSVQELLRQLDAGFSETVLKIAEEKNYKASAVYKRANLSKQNWYKMKSTPNYNPDKKTAIAYAIGLQLSLEETASLLERAGFVLSNSLEGDVIVRYFIEQGNYDIFKINEVLYDHDQYILGSF